MHPLPHLSARSHGSCRSTYEGEPTMRTTLALAMVLVALLAAGISLIVHGLM